MRLRLVGASLCAALVLNGCAIGPAVRTHADGVATYVTAARTQVSGHAVEARRVILLRQIATVSSWSENNSTRPIALPLETLLCVPLAQERVISGRLTYVGAHGVNMRALTETSPTTVIGLMDSIGRDFPTAPDEDIDFAVTQPSLLARDRVFMTECSNDLNQRGVAFEMPVGDSFAGGGAETASFLANALGTIRDIFRPGAIAFLTAIDHARRAQRVRNYFHPERTSRNAAGEWVIESNAQIARLKRHVLELDAYWQRRQQRQRLELAARYAAAARNFETTFQSLRADASLMRNAAAFRTWSSSDQDGVLDIARKLSGTPAVRAQALDAGDGAGAAWGGFNAQERASALRLLARRDVSAAEAAALVAFVDATRDVSVADSNARARRGASLYACHVRTELPANFSIDVPSVTPAEVANAQGAPAPEQTTPSISETTYTATALRTVTNAECAIAAESHMATATQALTTAASNYDAAWSVDGRAAHAALLDSIVQLELWAARRPSRVSASMLEADVGGFMNLLAAAAQLEAAVEKYENRPPT